MRISCVALVLGAGLVFSQEGAAPPKAGPSHFIGKVVPLADLLKKQGIAVDADAGSLVLVGDDGKVYSLVKTETTRMFFLDKRLRDRPMRLSGKLVPGSQLLHVAEVHSIIKGKLHDIYYWCDNCQLRYSEPGKCVCCGARTELIEEPVSQE